MITTFTEGHKYMYVLDCDEIDKSTTVVSKFLNDKNIA